jgi:PAS domain S-box-containing protein
MARRSGLTETPAPALSTIPSNGGVSASRAIAIDDELAAAPASRAPLDRTVAWLSSMADETTPAQRYGFAIAIAIIASGYAFVLDLFGLDLGMFAVPVLLVVLVTFVAGVRPGLLATALTILLIEIFVLDRRLHADFDEHEFVGFVAFTTAALIGSALSAAMRQSRARAMELADQRQQLLRAVLDNEQQVRDLADAMPVLVARATAGGRIDYYNSTLLDYTGKTQEELDRDGWLSIVHPDDAADALARWERRLQTGESEVFEQRLRRRDGAYRWHLVFGQAVRDASGAIRYWIGANVDIHDRKVIEEALLASQDRYRMLADSMQAMICMSSPGSDRLDFFNKRFYEYTGLAPDTLPERPMQAVLHPDDYAGALERWQRAQMRGESFSSEARFRRSDGAYRWHLTRATPLSAEGGGTRWMLTIVDIHDRKVAEESLEASEDRYRMLADSMEAVICMTSREDGLLEFFNKRFYEYTGLSPDAMPERPMQAVIHPDDFVEAVQLWYRGRETGDPFEGEFRYRRHDGVYHWHLARGTHVPSAEGPGTWMLTIVDIDDQKRTEAALRESEARYRTLIDAAPVFVYNTDARGAVTFVSESFYQYTGLKEATPLQTDPTGAIRKAIHPDDVRGVMRAWGAALQSGAGFEIEARVRGADGVYRWYLTRLVPSLDAAGSVTGWVGTSTGIDERKRAMDAMAAANAAKDEFLGLVSHELKTPITTILGNAEVLRRRGKLLDEESRAGALDDIQQDAVRLHQIIENLLILARLERGREIEMEPLLLPRVIDKVVADHRARFPRREIVVDAQADMTPVTGAEVYLEQVLRNLLSNAEKYSPPHMPMEVRAWCEARACVLEVRDRGIGIPPEERAHIFDTFWRSEATSHVAGVGIGLAVCKRLVEVQGGEIAYIPRDGGGSVFQVRLPSYEEEGEL